MRLGVAVHQISTSYDQARIGRSDDPIEGQGAWQPQQAIGGIYQKVLDGTRWMRDFDRSPNGNTISGYLDCWRVARFHRDAGRDWIPWSNVRGVAPRDEGQRLAFCALVARAPYAIANVEPYKPFWPHRGRETTKRATEFLEGFHHVSHGRVKLRLWIDARPWQMTYNQGIGFAEWLRLGGELIDGVLPEIYWTDFNTTPAKAIHNALELLTHTYNVPLDMIYPTYPADGTADELTLALLLSYLEGTGRPNIWQRINLSHAAGVAIAQWPEQARWADQV